MHGMEALVDGWRILVVFISSFLSPISNRGRDTRDDTHWGVTDGSRPDLITDRQRQTDARWGIYHIHETTRGECQILAVLELDVILVYHEWQ